MQYNKMISFSSNQRQTGDIDQQLVAMAIANKQHFARIVHRYELPLLHYIIRLGCKNVSVAEDILQEVFIKTFLHLNDYDSSLRFSSWIYRIAHNETISYFRKEKISLCLPNDSDLSFLIDNLCDTSEFHNSHHLQYTKEELQAALDQLDAKYRDIICLKFFEEKSYEDISDILQIPQGTVATLISRAKKKIKHIMEKNNNRI